MDELPRIIPLEITRAIITIAGWWVLYCKLHRPGSVVRRIALWISFAAGYGIFRFTWLSPSAYGFLWAGFQLFFALLSGDWRNSFFTALFYIGVEQTIDVTRSCAIVWFRGDWFVNRSLGQYIQYNCQYLFMLGWAIFYERLMRNHRRALPLHFMIMILTAPIAVFLILTRFMDVADPLWSQGTNIFWVGLSVGLIFFVSHHVSFYLYIRQMKLFDLEMSTQTMQSQLESQTRQNRLIEGAQKQAGEIRHEMKNLLFALQTELQQRNYHGIEQRLADILGEMGQYEQKSYTGIPVIDAMIAYKGEKLREQGAELSVRGDILYAPDSFAYDIASLLAIALDNAIDAASQGKASGVQGGLVRLSLQRRKNLLFITVSNPLTRPLKYRGSELQSTKPEPGHGFGIPALRRMAERYHGELRISGKEGVFFLEIMLDGISGAAS